MKCRGAMDDGVSALPDLHDAWHRCQTLATHTTQLHLKRCDQKKNPKKSHLRYPGFSSFPFVFLEFKAILFLDASHTLGLRDTRKRNPFLVFSQPSFPPCSPTFSARPPHQLATSGWWRQEPVPQVQEPSMQRRPTGSAAALWAVHDAG